MILSEDSILDTMVGVMQASLASGQTLKSITHMSPQHSWGKNVQGLKDRGVESLGLNGMKLQQVDLLF